MAIQTCKQIIIGAFLEVCSKLLMESQRQTISQFRGIRKDILEEGLLES